MAATAVSMHVVDRHVEFLASAVFILFSWFFLFFSPFFFFCLLSDFFFFFFFSLFFFPFPLLALFSCSFSFAFVLSLLFCLSDLSFCWILFSFSEHSCYFSSSSLPPSSVPCQHLPPEPIWLGQTQNSQLGCPPRKSLPRRERGRRGQWPRPAGACSSEIAAAYYETTRDLPC